MAEQGTWADRLAESYAAASNGTVPTETIKEAIGTPHLDDVLKQAGVSPARANLADQAVLSLFIAQNVI